MKNCYPRRRYSVCFALFCMSFLIIEGLFNGIYLRVARSSGVKPVPTHDVFIINQDWIHLRQTLISNTSSRKVLFLSYMRGGSKLGGEIFNRDPDGIMWHEPLAAYYMANYGLSFANLPQHTLYDKNLKEIEFSADEIDNMTSYLTHLLSCQFDRLPPHTWMHKFLFFTKAKSISSMRYCLQPKRQHAMVEQCKHLGQVCGHTLESRTKRCPLLLEMIRQRLSAMRSLPHSGRDDESIIQQLVKELKLNAANLLSRVNTPQINTIIRHELCVEKMRRTNVHCMIDGMRQCHEAELHVLKVNRMKMKDAEILLIKNPDLYIIHYVRDPRAIATSRIQRGLDIDRYNPDLLREVKLICRRMNDDIYYRKLLEAKYPNTTYVLRYEDLVLDPLLWVGKVYRFLGRNHNVSEWSEFFRTAIYGNKDHLSERKNGTECIDKWRYNLTPENMLSITNMCQDVLQELGYQ